MRRYVLSTNVYWIHSNTADHYIERRILPISSQTCTLHCNQTYVDWTEKAWDWISTSSLYVPGTPQGTKIYDGAGIEGNCKKPNPAQYSYNYGILIGGLAYIYNHTEDAKWLEPLYGISEYSPILTLTLFHANNVPVNATFNIFFQPDTNIMVEVGCEPYNACNTDGLTFKSFTMRWLAITTQLVPQTAETIWPYIQASANGAAAQCDGPDNDNCGYHWTTSTWDGSTGVGQQMSALAAIQANMLTVDDLFAPLTLDTGALSKGDASAGTGTPTTGPGE